MLWLGFSIGQHLLSCTKAIKLQSSCQCKHSSCCPWCCGYFPCCCSRLSVQQTCVMSLVIPQPVIAKLRRTQVPSSLSFMLLFYTRNQAMQTYKLASLLHWTGGSSQVFRQFYPYFNLFLHHYSYIDLCNYPTLANLVNHISLLCPFMWTSKSHSEL